MTTFEHRQTDHANHLIIEMDMSQHLQAMATAQRKQDAKEAIQVAKACLEESQAKKPQRQQALGVREKFFHDIYAAMPEDRRIKSLYDEFVTECSPVRRVLKEKGFQTLELADDRPIKDVRAYNMSLCEDPK